jgi:hypothetical protein
MGEYEHHIQRRSEAKARRVLKRLSTIANTLMQGLEQNLYEQRVTWVA